MHFCMGLKTQTTAVCNYNSWLDHSLQQTQYAEFNSVKLERIMSLLLCCCLQKVIIKRASALLSFMLVSLQLFVVCSDLSLYHHMLPSPFIGLTASCERVKAFISVTEEMTKTAVQTERKQGENKMNNQSAPDLQFRVSPYKS